MNWNGLTKLSLFSGILGDDLASEWAGIKTVCCVEIDPFCQKIIKKHYPDMPIIGDIHNVTKAKVKEVSGYEWVDIISGGDPCQPRSIAGKRRGREDNRDLWEDMFRVVCELKPTWVVNENPTGRLTMDFHEVLSDLESQGYETRSFVIPACAVNAPHRRDRLFIVAYNKSHRNINRQSSSIQRSNGQHWNNNQPTTHSDFGRAKQGYWNTRQLCTFTRGYNVTSSDQSAWQASWLEIATSLCRVDDGFPNRVARLKALGNACVPQQVYPIYRAITEVESVMRLEV